MKRKGYKFKLAPHLTFRQGNPERDKTVGGDPVPTNYVVVVKVKDCLDENGEFTLEKRDAAPMHGSISGHSRTNMIYSGERRCIRHRGKHYYNRNGDLCFAYTYWTSPVYWVEDGRVYQATSYFYDED